MRQLKEIASEVLEKKFSGDPKKMAAALESDLMYVRRLVGLAALDGATQQKTFEFTVRLLPICKELKIDPAQNLKQLSDTEVFKNVESTGRKARRYGPKGKKRHEA